MINSFFIADTVTSGAEQGLQQTFIMVGLAIVFFYFILWRPEQKRRKELDAKRQAMKKGDKVVVAGGIVAEVYKVQDETIIVKLVDGAKMEVIKAAVQDLQPTAVTSVKEPEEQ
jgi:preprotein translocase subunit YajC